MSCETFACTHSISYSARMPEYPMRINKYLAREGITTRRGADELITRGKVLLNGRVAVLGDQVAEGDKVELRGEASPKTLLYYAYNKPAGEVTGPLPLLPDLFPLGRLDKDSSGLLILTNDGRVTNRLLNPDYEHDKEYRVQTSNKLRDGFKKAMETGVDIEGYLTRPCSIRATGPNLFTITLTEGKKHQIRRMVSALHNSVSALERTRIVNIKLGGLAPGNYRPIESEELSTFLARIGLT